MYYGVQYYPEHWPEERWAEDARLMQEAGVNGVRIGEFAWSFYEPRPGRVDFSAMDRALDVLHEAGIVRDELDTPAVGVLRACVVLGRARPGVDITAGGRLVR